MHSPQTREPRERMGARESLWEGANLPLCHFVLRQLCWQLGLATGAELEFGLGKFLDLFIFGLALVFV